LDLPKYESLDTQVLGVSVHVLGARQAFAEKLKRARKTNHVERFNNTLSQRVSRLVRETLSCSKQLANQIGAIKYSICHDNLARAAALPV
jgi:IS1 family transposase